MSGSTALTAFAPAEYEAIAATMSDSARGRWFLAEHARRTRGADTDVLLGAMARLETVVTQGRADGIGHLRGDLMEMADAISRTKSEIAAISDPDQDQTRLGVASEALDGIVRATERATSDILGAAEHVQEAAWTLRERGVDPNVCDDLDRRATQIYTACSFQDLTAQRTGRIVHTLRYLEERLIAMMAIWGDADGRVPPAPGQAPARTGKDAPPDDLCQSDVDRYIDMEAPAVAAAAAALRAIEPGSTSLHDDIVFLPALPEPEPFFSGIKPEWAEAFEADILAEDAPTRLKAAAPETAVAPTPPPSPKAETALSFADIDALSVEEKLALFC
ncbi:hypothetical protein [uncultured Methylobacterium sp.]|uniref:hypothetical protein n=1 Tax=uncultured Methylobacterium sp. TaxID=157278 RepID=UPI0035CAEFE1